VQTMLIICLELLLADANEFKRYFAREKDRSKDCGVCNDVLGEVLKVGNFEKEGLFQCALYCKRKHEGGGDLKSPCETLCKLLLTNHAKEFPCQASGFCRYTRSELDQESHRGGPVLKSEL